MVREKISIIILTKDEEKNIAPCLETVKWADEIIVIDDLSGDNTVEIAKRYTDKVISNRLEGDFSRQRNLGIDRSTGVWILQMDADERVTDGLREEILGVLSNGTTNSAFTFKRANNFCGKFLAFGGENSHRPLRLFKKGKARYNTVAIHEELVVEGKVGELQGVMEHYNFPTISHYIQTQDFYSGIEAGQIFKKDGLIPKSRLKKEMSAGCIKLFFKVYFKKEGYRDGIHGLVFAMLSAWRRFLIYAKYWEMNKEQY